MRVGGCKPLAIRCGGSIPSPGTSLKVGDDMIIEKGFKKQVGDKWIGYFKCDACHQVTAFWGPSVDLQISFIGFCVEKGVNTWIRPADTADLMGAKLQGKLLPLDLWKQDRAHTARQPGEPFQGDLNKPKERT